MEGNYEILQESECGYKCDCSRDRMERNLISIGKKDLKELAEEQEDAEIVCHFCNKRYVFTSEELLGLITE